MGIDLGRDLGTRRLTWRKLRVCIENFDEHSASFRARNPEHYGWDLHSHLLAAVVDALSIANWQRVGKKTARRPEPVPRPGAKKTTRQYGATAMSFAEADAWLAGDGVTFETTENDLFV